MSHISPYTLGGYAPVSSQDRAQDHPYAGSLVSNPPAPAMPAQSGAAPVALPPGLDLSALAGVSPEQVALIARLLQSGALPNPIGSSQSIHANTVPASPSNVDTGSTTHKEVARIKEGSEREEGEVDSDSSVRDFPDSHRPSESTGKYQSRAFVASASTQGQVTSHPAQVHPPASHKITRLSSKRASVKAFVSQLQSSGYSFSDVAPHVQDVKMLQRLYQELNLPYVSRNVAATPPVTAHPKVPDSNTTVDRTKVVDQNAKRVIPSPAPVIADRSEYLAKLAAARAKPKPQPQPQPQSAHIFSQKPSTLSPVVKNCATSNPQKSTPAKVSYDTEVVKQRLAALRAERAASKAAGAKADNQTPTKANNDANLLSANPEQLTLGSPGTAAIDAQAPRNVMIAPVSSLQTTSHGSEASATPFPSSTSPLPATLGRPFGSLPGLFMTFSGAQQSSTPAAVVTSSDTGTDDLSRKRSYSGDAVQPTDIAEPPAKQPFGQSRQQSPEQVVIQFSDEEDQDEEGVHPGAEVKGVSMSEGRSPAAPPTPASGSSTPRSNADYHRKLKELEDLKRKLAERERAKLTGRSTAGQGESGQQSPSIPTRSTPAGPVATVTLPQEDPAATSGQRSQSIVSSPQQQERAGLRQRLHQLEQNLQEFAARGTLAQNSEQNNPTLSGRSPDGSHDSPPPTEETHDVRISGALSATEEQVNNNSSNGSQHVESGLQAPADPAEKTAEQSSIQARSGSSGESINYSPSDSAADATLELILTDTPPLASASDDSDSAAMSVESDSRSETGSESHSGSESDLMSVSDTAVAENAQLSHFSAEHTGDRSEQSASLSQDTAQSTDRRGQSEDESDDMSIAEDDSDGTDDSSDEEDATSLHEPSNSDDEADMSIDEDDSNGPGAELDNQQFDNDKDVSSGRDDIDGEDENSANGGFDGTFDGVNEHEEQVTAQHSESSPVGTASLDLRESQGPKNVAARPKFEEYNAVAVEHEPQHEPGTNGPDREEEKVQPKNIFTPYESPLTRFKDYRYHPQYLNTVSGGYKSLTYNHNIDPDKFICPYELGGGQCNDRQCEHQHFSSLPLSDDDLLKSLVSSGVPPGNAELGKRWKEGLGTLIKQLRTGGRQPDAVTVAARISELRRDLIGDATKVVAAP